MRHNTLHKTVITSFCFFNSFCFWSPENKNNLHEVKCPRVARNGSEGRRLPTPAVDQQQVRGLWDFEVLRLVSINIDVFLYDTA